MRLVAATYQLFCMEVSSLLPALAGLRPFPGEEAPSSIGPPSQEATIVRRQAVFFAQLSTHKPPGFFSYVKGACRALSLLAALADAHLHGIGYDIVVRVYCDMIIGRVGVRSFYATKCLESQNRI